MVDLYDEAIIDITNTRKPVTSKQLFLMMLNITTIIKTEKNCYLLPDNSLSNLLLLSVYLDSLLPV